MIYSCFQHFLHCIIVKGARRKGKTVGQYDSEIYVDSTMDSTVFSVPSGHLNLDNDASITINDHHETSKIFITKSVR